MEGKKDLSLIATDPPENYEVWRDRDDGYFGARVRDLGELAAKAAKYDIKGLGFAPEITDSQEVE